MKYLFPWHIYATTVLKGLIGIEMVPYVKDNKLVLNTSLDMCVLLLEIATVDHLQCIRYIRYLPSSDALTWFCQWVESIRFYKSFNHDIELINIVSDTCHSTM